MNRRITIGVLAAVGLLLPTLEGPAAARSVSAAVGGGDYGGTLTRLRFTYNASTGAARASGPAPYHIALTTDRSGTKAVTLTGRSAPGTTDLAHCFAYAWDRFGGSLSTSADRDLPASATFQSLTLDPVVVPSMGAFAVGCRLNSGSELMEFDYSR